jgi:hypothetical protein
MKGLAFAYDPGKFKCVPRKNLVKVSSSSRFFFAPLNSQSSQATQCGEPERIFSKITLHFDAVSFFVLKGVISYKRLLFGQ